MDVVTIGKMAQACATLFTDDFVPRPGLISQTFTASSSAIHAARAIINELLNGGYFGEKGKIALSSEYFMHRLLEMSERHPQWIRGPFGFGAMIAVTLFDGSRDKAKTFLQELFRAGVIAFIAGKAPYRIRFLLPVGGITTDDIESVCRIIEKTLEKTARDLEKKKE